MNVLSVYMCACIYLYIYESHHLVILTKSYLFKFVCDYRLELLRNELVLISHLGINQLPILDTKYDNT